MQEEVDQKTIALAVKTGKLTAQVLQAAIRKYLAARQKGTGKAHHGQQSLRQLKKDGSALSNIEITDANIGLFKLCAKKYDIDFSWRPFNSNFGGKGENHRNPPQKGGEKMETIPRNDFILRHRYDAFCKAVLRNEAKSYWSEMAHRREREKSLDALTQEEMDKLSVVDDYPSDSYVFSSYGYDLLIDNELVAEAFASLPEQEQSILILHCVLDLADGEIGSLMGMSRSAVLCPSRFRGQ